jgi:hypothetical protein
MTTRDVLSRLTAAALILAGSSGTASASTASVQNLCTPSIITNEVVATADARRAAGKLVRPPSVIDPVNGFAWPDTQLGIVKSLDGTSWLFFGSDGGCHANCDAVTDRYGSITRTIGTLGDPLGSTPPVETVLTSKALAPPVDYVGGGPVIRVPPGLEGAGGLLIVYHIERATYFPPHHYPDPLQYQKSFYSSLGLAKSTDDGLTWTDLGEIISANRPYRADGPPFDVGDGNLIIDPTHKYFYIYFPDSVPDGESDTFMSVARAPVAAVLDAAFGGGPRAGFHKLYRGAWDEPGLGGRSTTVLPRPFPSYAGDAVVAFDDSLGRYIAILDDTQNINYAESPDGLTWADPAPILRGDPAVSSVLYGAPASLTGDSGTVGQRYFIYYTDYPNDGSGWAGAQLRRLTVSCPAPRR